MSDGRNILHCTQIWRYQKSDVSLNTSLSKMNPELDSSFSPLGRSQISAKASQNLEMPEPRNSTMALNRGGPILCFHFQGDPIP
jgi:hypothetical protein